MAPRTARTTTAMIVVMTALVAAMACPATSSAATVAAVPSDFNGVGYADLAVGVPVESVGSLS